MVEDNIIEEIKSRLDIVDVIAEYADLKKAGSNFKALCPFHSEKTPSFMVSPQKQIFHCFGCGAGGDIFGFIMRYENVPFPEARDILAKRAGVELKRSYVSKPSQDKEILYNINDDAALFYSAKLKKYRAAREYIKKRGFDEETIKTFRLGYAPPQYEALLTHLKEKGYAERVIEKAGLIRYSDRKKPYDMFRGRIIFPISDRNGRIVAFGGRILDDQTDSAAPKYINSPETGIFKKSDTLYGLYIGQKAIREKDYAVVAEGYTDVIVCHQYGFKHAVAPLGTALTEGHLKKIRAFTKKLLLIFDADQAGFNAARRSLRLIYEKGLKAKVLTLPDGDDPDSFLKKHGAEALQQKLFSESRDLVQFYVDLEGDRTEIIGELTDIVSQVPDRILQGELIKAISKETLILDINIKEEIRNRQKGKKESRKQDDQLGVALPEEVLFTIAFTNPEYSQEIIKRINIEDIEKTILKNILLKAMEMGNLPSLNNVSSLFSESETSYITALIMKADYDTDKLKENIDACFAKIHKKVLSRKIKKIDQYIKEADSAKDYDKVTSLQKEKMRLKQEAIE